MLNISGFDVDSYISQISVNGSNAPVLALTLSGGGLRAEINGLGLYQAMDNQYDAAVQAKTGGLSNSLTYVTGLSGGSIGVRSSITFY